MKISLIRLILHTKTNVNFTDCAPFILENYEKSLYSDTRFLTFGTSKILILEQKTSKIAHFEKSLLRQTFCYI